MLRREKYLALLGILSQLAQNRPGPVCPAYLVHTPGHFISSYTIHNYTLFPKWRSYSFRRRLPFYVIFILWFFPSPVFYWIKYKMKLCSTLIHCLGTSFYSTKVSPESSGMIMRVKPKFSSSPLLFYQCCGSGSGCILSFWVTRIRENTGSGSLSTKRM